MVRGLILSRRSSGRPTTINSDEQSLPRCPFFFEVTYWLVTTRRFVGAAGFCPAPTVIVTAS